MGSGLFILGIATFGVFRFNYVLNRIHVAAKCDTLGAILFLSGLAVCSGFSWITLKLILIVIFIWFSNPIANHLVAKTEFETNRELEDMCEVIEIDKKKSFR
jgi:multicomponent Na+:H+ antiporter subunit G